MMCQRLVVLLVKAHVLVVQLEPQLLLVLESFLLSVLLVLLRLLRFLYGGIRYMGLFNQSTANFYVSCFLLSCIRELFTVKSLNQNPREFWWSDWSKIVVVLFCLSFTDSWMSCLDLIIYCKINNLILHIEICSQKVGFSWLVKLFLQIACFTS